jgi:hypothetical protein
LGASERLILVRPSQIAQRWASVAPRPRNSWKGDCSFEAMILPTKHGYLSRTRLPFWYDPGRSVDEQRIRAVDLFAGEFIPILPRM